jgi:hypothetical protein
MGIQPADTRQVGLYGDPSWSSECRHENCQLKPFPASSATTAKSSAKPAR